MFADGVIISDIDRLLMIRNDAPQEDVQKLSNDYKQELQTRLYKMEQIFKELRNGRM